MKRGEEVEGGDWRFLRLSIAPDRMRGEYKNISHTKIILPFTLRLLPHQIDSCYMVMKLLGR
jgi:hypothetical protein